MVSQVPPVPVLTARPTLVPRDVRPNKSFPSDKLIVPDTVIGEPDVTMLPLVPAVLTATLVTALLPANGISLQVPACVVLLVRYRVLNEGPGVTAGISVMREPSLANRVNENAVGLLMLKDSPTETWRASGIVTVKLPAVGEMSIIEATTRGLLPKSVDQARVMLELRVIAA